MMDNGKTGNNMEEVNSFLKMASKESGNGKTEERSNGLTDDYIRFICSMFFVFKSEQNIT